MNILVTGGAGFVGTNLIQLFLNKTKYKIISIDNYSSGKRSNHIKNKRIKYINGKTVDISKLIKNSKEIKFRYYKFKTSNRYTYIIKYSTISITKIIFTR